MSLRSSSNIPELRIWKAGCHLSTVCTFDILSNHSRTHNLHKSQIQLIGATSSPLRPDSLTLDAILRLANPAV